jgi:transcriptional regulator with XRE-family HTH domain
MTPREFKLIRHSLLLTQQELADLLGYRQKVRISEYERSTNPVPIPDHIAMAMYELERTAGRSTGKMVRDWSPRRAA